MFPQRTLFNMITGGRVAQLIYVAAKLGIADSLKDGPKTCDELARAVGVQPRPLYRVMRALASIGVFAELDDGRFDLTTLATSLQTGVQGSYRAMAIAFGEEYHHVLGDLLHSVKTGETAFDHLYGAGYFEYLMRRPESAKVFNEFMAQQRTLEYDSIVASYDFSGINTLVDVGGGSGSLIARILAAYPKMKGVLFDTQVVTEEAKTYLEAAGVAGRCRVVAGDFFDSVPEGGDAYVLSWVLHDWNDARAVSILRNIRRAMTDNGRLIIFDQVLPPGNARSAGKLMDVLMMVVTGGEERTESGFARILTAAGLKLSRAILTHLEVDVVEAVPVSASSVQYPANRVYQHPRSN